ncbi:MAG: acetoacetate--CoA ligase [Acidimicrobiales bacterium]
MTAPQILWSPDPDAARRTRVAGWMASVAARHGVALEDYDGAWRWSVDHLDEFWSSVWDFLELIGDGPEGPVITDADMPGTRWFDGWTLNYANNVLARLPSGPALLSHSQTRDPVELTGAELSEQVARCRAGLVGLGVGRGDRVVAYLPNVAEAVIAMLATASLGAVWSSCPPEFGVRGVIDRFAQIEPKVLIAVDGYRHRGRVVDRRAEVADIRAGLPTLVATVGIGYLDPSWAVDDGLTWDSLLAGNTPSASPPPLSYEAVPFDHPLYVLYSSGTTGLPKPIVHGHGGILVEHAKMLALHHDLGPGDRFFWFSTTGWMMWNYLVSALAVGASIVLFDGDPGYPDLDTLWRLAAETGITSLGASAPWLLACAKAGVTPGASFDLSVVREIGSTGAPLPAEGFRWVYEHVGRDLRLASMSGGTDVCTAFVGGSPILPVIAGEISCRALGARVEAYDEDGRSVVGEQGNLVVTAPMPSMPVGLWGDPDGSRYRAAYFERYPGVWDHGDWITITDRGTCVITGRSDSTLNRGGVRLGTSDFYSVVEALTEVADSLVIHLEDPEGGPGELLLFVALAEGSVLDDALTARIAGELRTSLSPRHVPDRVIAVPSVPRTLSGKKLEIPVKRILNGVPAATAASRDALTDARALEPFEAMAAARKGGDRSGGPSGARI